MKQTAVEFAVEQLEQLIPFGHQLAVRIILVRIILEQAKEMEKQQKGYSDEEVLNLLTHFAVEIQRQNKRGQYPIEIKGWFERNKDKFKNK
jgi:hypothetical protein